MGSYFRLPLIGLCLTFLVPCLASITFHDKKQATFVASLKDYHLVTPTRVTEQGEFLSHRLHHQHTIYRKRRDVSEQARHSSPNTIHYKLSVKSLDLHLRLKPNDILLSPGAVIETRNYKYKNVSDSDIRKAVPSRCHFLGDIKNHLRSVAAVSTCGGLTGLLRTNKGDFFIEPVKGHNYSDDAAHPHIIYTHKDLPEIHDKQKDQNHDVMCGVTDFEKSEAQREEWENSRDVSEEDEEHHHRMRRSVSRERYVETLVVLDPTMNKYYENENLEQYILTVMNMVASIYHEASLGNAVNIVIVRIIRLTTDEPGLKITHHADRSLNSFCKWQKTVNPITNHKNHHDVAVLITRKNICSRMNEPCSTLGLAQVNGMCQAHRSCNINEDTGLNLAFTIAHELGHNFGMRHDLVVNHCIAEDAPFHQLIMAAQLYLESFPVRWSNCSRQAITKFLDRGWGYCLENEPEYNEDYKKYQEYSYTPPGVIYDANHQCRLQYNHDAEYCSGIDDANVCTTLWCRVNKRCLTRLEAAAEGTKCGDNMWCFNGQCTVVGQRPEAIHGEWGEWKGWTDCTRECGGGVSHNERHCDSPVPQNGGKYCLGLRKRYRTCNTQECPPGTPTFHEQQCSEFNYQPIRNGLYEWVPVSTRSTPCQLHCRPKKKYFSLMLKDVVSDGTPCRPGTRDMCIHGICTKVGCDWKIDSTAQEDRCGVCMGAGKTCKEVREEFDLKLGHGYVEAQLIPAGARNIRVEEVAAANNYLAIKNEKGKYYLNGDWFINWSGDYEAAGTTIRYRRNGNKETFEAPGPLKENIHVMLLFQSPNPGIRFHYTVPKGNATLERMPEFHWKYADWTHCSVSCGGGVQMKIVSCVEKESGTVQDKYCDHNTRPDDFYRACNDQDCPARWHAYPWQRCSVTCGTNGTRKRTVLCIQHRDGFEEAMDDQICSHTARPAAVEPCKPKAPCPAAPVWTVGVWSNTCHGNPCAVQTRDVRCSSKNGNCDIPSKPASQRQCGNITCGSWQIGTWSKCTRSCGGGIQFRTVSCLPGHSCPGDADLPTEQVCNPEPCPGTKTKHTEPEAETNQINKNLHSVIVEPKVAKTTEIVNVYTTFMEISTKANRISKNPDDVSTLTMNKEGTTPMIHITTKYTTTPSSASSMSSKPLTTARSTLSYAGHVPLDIEVPDPGEHFDVQVEPGKLNQIDADKNNVKHDEDLSNEINNELEPTVNPGSVMWIVSDDWDPCTKGCGGGTKTQIAHCVSIITAEKVSQSNCSHLPNPATTQNCEQQLCLQWQSYNWSPCSVTCGIGIQRRDAICPKANSCDMDERPETVRPCYPTDCLAWVSGPWSTCTKSCGGGEISRHVQCVNETSLQPAEGCNPLQEPVGSKSCNTDLCPQQRGAAPSEFVCHRDMMASNICKMMKRLCTERYFQLKCCYTCAKQMNNKHRKRAKSS